MNQEPKIAMKFLTRVNVSDAPTTIAIANSLSQSVERVHSYEIARIMEGLCGDPEISNQVLKLLSAKLAETKAALRTVEDVRCRLYHILYPRKMTYPAPSRRSRTCLDSSASYRLQTRRLLNVKSKTSRCSPLPVDSASVKFVLQLDVVSP